MDSFFVPNSKAFTKKNYKSQENTSKELIYLIVRYHSNSVGVAVVLPPDSAH